MNWTLWLQVASDGGTETLVRIDVEGDRQFIKQQMPRVRYAAIMNAPELRGLSNPTIKSELLQIGEWREPAALQEKLAESKWSVSIEVVDQNDGDYKELRLTFDGKPDEPTLVKLYSVTPQVAIEMGMLRPATGKMSIQSGDFRAANPDGKYPSRQ